MKIFIPAGVFKPSLSEKTRFKLMTEINHLLTNNNWRRNCRHEFNNWTINNNI